MVKRQDIQREELKRKKTQRENMQRVGKFFTSVSSKILLPSGLSQLGPQSQGNPSLSTYRVQYNIVQYITVYYIILQYITLQYSTL